MTRSTKTEGPEYAAFIRRLLRAMGKRAAAGDLESLAEMVKLRAALDEQITAGARGAHDDGFSWTEIGNVLGITRQAARQQFAAPPAPAAAAGEVTE